MERGARTVPRNEPKFIVDLRWRGWARFAANNISDESESRFYKCRGHRQHGHVELPGTPSEVPTPLVARTASTDLVHLFAFDRHRVNRHIYVSQHANFYFQPEH